MGTRGRGHRGARAGRMRRAAAGPTYVELHIYECDPLAEDNLKKWFNTHLWIVKWDGWQGGWCRKELF